MRRYSLIDKESFLKQINNFKNDYNIKPKSKNINDTERRRITILVIDEFLKAGGDNIQAIFLEQELYERLKGLKLRCDPINYEIRAKENKIKNFSPLKLTSEPHNYPCGRKSKIVTELLKTLTEKEKTNGATKPQIRRLTYGREPRRVFPGKQIHRRKMAP